VNGEAGAGPRLPANAMAALIWLATGLVMLVAALLLLAALVLAALTGAGQGWRLSFWTVLSLGFLFCALALLTHRTLSPTIGTWLVGVAWAAAAAGALLLLEAWVGMAGAAAHLAGIAAMILLVAAATVGVLALCLPAPAIGPGLRWGTALGLLFGVLLALGRGGAAGPSFAALLPMLAAPLAGWLGDRRGRRGPLWAILAALAMFVVVASMMAPAAA